MSFEIFPQSINLFPGDVQLFTIRNNPPPAIWISVTGGSITADHNITVTTNTEALALAHMLGEIGGLKWHIDNRMMPAVGGSLRLDLASVGSDHDLQVEVTTANTIAHFFSPGGNLDVTTGHVLAIGDEFYLQVAGQALRLYINGSLVASHVATNNVAYPYFCFVKANLPMANVAPRIQSPEFIGDWGLEPDFAILDAWSAGGGTITPAVNSVQTTYTAGVVPGTYTVQATLSASAYQTVNSIVVIEALTIEGETDITVEPGSSFRIPTNYDRAQHGQLVTWSVISGGGSFTNGIFTAPTTPGTTLVLGVRGTQTVQATIRVPVVVTPSKKVATLGELINFTTNLGGSITWTADLGTASGSGAVFAWTAPNQSQMRALITVTNGTFTKTIEMWVLKIFPYDPHVPFDGVVHKTVLIGRSQSRRRFSRVLDPGGQSFEDNELPFLGRSITEYNAAVDFWEEHHPQLSFIYNDKLRNTRWRVYFDSDVSRRFRSQCAIDYTFRIVEA
jgi:hypothetical protein